MMPAKKCPCGEATYTLVKLTTTAAQIKCVACGIERVTKSADELEKIKAQRQVPQGYEQPAPPPTLRNVFA